MNFFSILVKLCLPKGLVFQKHYSKPKYHPFIITREDGSRIFGGTLTFFESVEDDGICNAMQALQTMYDAEFSNSNTSKTISSTSMSVSTANNMPRFNHQRSASTSCEASRSIDQFSSSRRAASRAHTVTTPVTAKENDNDSDSVISTTNGESIKTTYDMILKNSNFQNKSSPLRNSVKSSNINNNNNVPSPMSPTKVSHYNILKDRLYASKCICLLSQYPFVKAFNKILQTLYDMVEQTDLLGINLESHIYNLIYEIPMPLSGKLMQFKIGCRKTSVYMPRYSSSEELPLFDYDLMESFRLLGVGNMINLYITALLEHQILLYSKDYYSLMLIAESLAILFFPFTWLKPYVPIVPASNLHFIEAPVPYIMGFHHKDIDKDFFKQGQRCFVDIDSGTVTCPEGLPDFPEKNKFIKEINDILVYFSDKKNQVKLKKQKIESKKFDQENDATLG